jgi:protein-S-isoprenylcysteine O-methyltransferase Ste14
MLRLTLFVAASALFLRLSWRSLRDARAHGFYRFFAFELLLALVLLNAPVWFHDPFCYRQWLSWALGLASIGLAVEGFQLLRVVGRPSPVDVRASNLAFENTTTLVTTGLYRYIRHPMYASLLALAGCAYLKDPKNIVSLLFALGAAISLVATALIEERENLAFFGAPYGAYMERTRRFVPFVF